MKTLDDLVTELDGDPAKGRCVFVRADLNVPLDGTNITDDGRIRASLPTLLKLRDAGARVVVAAHLGRPKPGADNSKYSLAPVAARLGSLLGADKPKFLAEWLLRRSGPLTSSVAEAFAFVRSRPGLPAPDLQYHFAPAYFNENGFDELGGAGRCRYALGDRAIHGSTCRSRAML